MQKWNAETCTALQTLFLSLKRELHTHCAMKLYGISPQSVVGEGDSQLVRHLEKVVLGVELLREKFEEDFWTVLLLGSSQPVALEEILLVSEGPPQDVLSCSVVCDVHLVQHLREPLVQLLLLHHINLGHLD